jgi:Na+/melibiose symporter-like transporter
VLVFFLLAASAFALFQVPYIAMPAEITDSVEERTTMMSWRVAFLAFGILLFGVGAPALRDAASGGASGYLLMAVGVASVIAIGMLGCWWALRRTRPVTLDSSGAPSHSLRQQFAVAWRTRAFRLLLAAFVIQALATGAMLAAAQYFATYVLGKESMSDVLFAALIVPALVVMPLWAWVGHHHGKRAGYLLSSVVFLAGALMLLASSLVPSAVVLVLVGLCGIGYAGMQMFPLAMLPDAIAADAAATGQQRAGAFTGVWTAGETVGFAVGPALVLLVLAVSGFVSSSGEAVDQPDSARVGVLLTFSVLPALLVAASLPLIHRFHIDPTDPPQEEQHEHSATGT